MRLRLVGCLALGFLPGPGELSGQDLRSVANEVITGADIQIRINLMAADSMLGRATPSPGLDATAAWVANELRSMGLRPAGDRDELVHWYPIRDVAHDFEESSLGVGGFGPTLRMGEDFLSLAGGGARDVEGEIALVFGGDHAEATLRYANLEGRMVVLRPSEGGSSVDRLVEQLVHKAPAAIIVMEDADDSTWKRAWDQARRNTFRVVGDSPPGVPIMRVRREAFTPTLEALGIAISEISEPAQALRVRVLPDARAHLRLAAEVLSEAWAPNVVALLEGSDPVLRDEYVVVSAHMDHVGVRSGARGDSVFNGADDNASGTALVLEVAEAMASLSVPPRRSMLFVLVSGEERGLWGSEQFLASPPVPLDRIVADLNADMVSRNSPDSIVVIGQEHSDLGETLDQVLSANNWIGMLASDDRWPGEGFFFRSDHFNFARRGIPVLFFFNGVHEDYHELGDEPDGVDAVKAAKVARLVFVLAHEVASRERRPQWVEESYRTIVGQPATGG